LYSSECPRNYNFHTMTDLYKANLLHSALYLDRAGRAQNLYLRGGEDAIHGVQIFEQEWPNVQRGQAWSARMLEKDDTVADICSMYPEACIYLLNLKVHPSLIINWLEQALSSAKRKSNSAQEKKILGFLGLPYLHLGDLQSAIGFFQDYLAICIQDKDRNGESAALANLGVVSFPG